MITCRELIEFIDRYVEGDLPAAERDSFESHLRACPSCVNYLDGYRTTIALSRGAAKDDELGASVPDELVQAIVAARRSGP